jgi:hypothetical protein
MRFFFRRHVPRFDRVLLVESGARELYENLIPRLHETHGGKMRLDLVTCFQGAPRGFPESGRVWRVSDYPDGASRQRLYAELAAQNYSILGIICSDEPLMTKWKWMLAARIPAKLFVLNENGDYFFADYSNWKIIRHFFYFRSGLAEGGAVRTISRLLLFPFTLAYLLLYFAFVHLRRLTRS